MEMTRENAMAIVKAFKELINGGNVGTRSNWEYVIGLMAEFGIDYKEV